MPYYVTCEACSEEYDDKGSFHECPGSPADRCDDLEVRLAIVEERLDVAIAALRTVEAARGSDRERLLVVESAILRIQRGGK